MKLTVKEAARLMGASPGFVRRGLQQQRLPIGAAVLTDSMRWSYWIDHAQLAAYLKKDATKVAKIVTIWRGEGDEQQA